MKRTSAFLVFMMFLAFSGKGQEIGLSFQYSYIYSKSWNEAIQTYNFSRPFLENKQPLLRHGFGLGLYRIGTKAKKSNHGISAMYNSFLSTSENTNYDITIKTRFLDVGYLLRHKYKPSEINGWSWEVRADLKTAMLSRHLNDEIVKIESDDDETNLRTFGVGFQLDARLCHSSGFGKHMGVTKFVGIYYSPYTWAYRGELVFNESSTRLKSNTSLLGFRIGASYPIYWKTTSETIIEE